VPAKWMRVVSFVAVAALVGSSCSARPAAPHPPERSEIASTSPPGDVATVTRVLDGDSFQASIDGVAVEVRLLGINAPEDTECHGDTARAVLESWLSSGEVTLVAGGEAATDQFDRDLRYVYVGGVNVNLALIESGDALALQTGHPLESQFLAAADDAAGKQLGMWSPEACDESTPLPDVAIVDYSFNPPGRDQDDLTGEWVAIVNTAPTAVVMGAWTLRDESSQNRYRFPDGFALGGGTEVLVRTGCGAATHRELFWCASDPVWNNAGDTIILQTAQGTVVDWERYRAEAP
jgi:endonuclease YncB( thermonuclease family)